MKEDTRLCLLRLGILVAVAAHDLAIPETVSGVSRLAWSATCLVAALVAGALVENSFSG